MKRVDGHSPSGLSKKTDTSPWSPAPTWGVSICDFLNRCSFMYYLPEIYTKNTRT